MVFGINILQNNMHAIKRIKRVIILNGKLYVKLTQACQNFIMHNVFKTIYGMHIILFSKLWYAYWFQNYAMHIVLQMDTCLWMELIKEVNTMT